MATESEREEVLADIKTTLEGITEAAGYNTTIKYISRDEYEDFTDFQIDKYPLLLVLDGDEDVVSFTNDMDKGTMNVIVTALMCGEDGTPTSTEMNRLLRDIRKILYVDRGRGCHAIYTQITRIAFRRGMIPPFGDFQVNIQVVYQYLTSAP